MFHNQLPNFWLKPMYDLPLSLARLDSPDKYSLIKRPIMHPVLYARDLLILGDNK